MALPASHVASLEPLLRNHEARLAELEASLHAAGDRMLVEREIEIHKALIGLGRSQNVHDVLGEVAADPHLARRAARDPGAFAKERGIALPRNLKIELHVVYGRVSMVVSYYSPLASFMLLWNSEGFRLAAAPTDRRP
jgi:hypothetical protein